jgi:ribosomal protein S18 acetylase RimI-like enzyme
MSDIAYTLATEAHIQTLIDFRLNFLIDFGGPQTQLAQEALIRELESYFNRHINDRSYICWFAHSENNVVGIGGMAIQELPGNFKNPQGKRGYILNMYTSPAFRNKGICSTILNKLMETAKEMGINTFELHATKAGEPVYVKNGFTLHNEPTYRKHDSP